LEAGYAAAFSLAMRDSSWPNFNYGCGFLVAYSKNFCRHIETIGFWIAKRLFPLTMHQEVFWENDAL
jgi:hypothetical protein